MKKALAILLSFSMFLTGCAAQDVAETSSEGTEQAAFTEITATTTVTTTAAETTAVSEQQTTAAMTTTAATAAVPGQLLSVDTSSREYIESLGFTNLNDPNFMQYVEDTVYYDLVEQLNSDEYFVENVEAIYISKEYLDELAYNSQENIFFGYTLSELDAEFEGEQYIFTLDENGQTTVVPFEENDDDTYVQAMRNVAIGTGVILLCVTVSAVTAGAGAPAVSMIFAASAKTATSFALSSAVISGVSAGVVEGIKTQDFDQALKAAALKGSEGFKWGAITGAVVGGAGQAVALKGATLNGLTMNEAALIQKETGYPLDVIKQFKSWEEYQIYKKANLYTQMVDGKLALMQEIDLTVKSTLPNGREVTNLERMLEGYAPIEGATNKAYQLHHIGQKSDATLAVLTESQHQGNSAILNTIGKESEIDRAAFRKVKEAFWIDLGRQFQKVLSS